MRGVSTATAGFTLLELIIVLVLAGLFMVVSIPALRDTLVDDPLKSSARRLIGYLDNVRELAVRDQQGYVLRIDLNENAIQFFSAKEVEAEEAAVSSEKNRFQPKSDVRLRSVWQQGQDPLSGGVVELWVTRQGYWAKSVLHLEDGGHEAISLALSPFLVQIEIHDGVYEPDRKTQ